MNQLANINANTSVQKEIDIIDFISILWVQRWIIVTTCVFFVCLGLFYIGITKPIYEAKAYILPPDVNDISVLNQSWPALEDKQEEKQYTPGDVYGLFQQNLLGEYTKREFFTKIFLPSVKSKKNLSTDALYHRMNGIISVKEIPKSDPKKYVATVRKESPAEAATWLEQYLNMANENTKIKLLKIIRSQVDNQIYNLKLQINIAKELGQKERKDRIVQLKEAINIAKAINLNESIQLSQNSQLGDSLSDSSLLYQRGSRVLEAELNNLNQRNSDIPFLNKVREIQGKLKIYKNISINPKDFSVFELDGSINKPDAPIWPKKILILACTLLLGLVVGIPLAVLRNFQQEKKKRLVIS
ncbi:Chain length determinant protein [Legionella adelaidensis]|uniref:Chain length determinant protein n=1 Tax=Legionella adelaidensis TaxID=45056 RepID=A0A0W0R4W4_9GAMM|nr:Wzz/FepE/Etk N-terminal domain-containing protein [Legionella adelaidensis]KTC66091.1 Chain length determinant protein [Legionella adelaidensis]